MKQTKKKYKKNKHTQKVNIHIGGKKQRTHKKHYAYKNNFKKLNCSPSKKLKFTCYSPRSLIKLKNEWNKDFPDKKIYSNDPYTIWNKLKNFLDKKCTNEKCWLSQSFISDNLDKNLTKNTFAPSAPPTWKKNPNEWLNSIDINNVMHQYEEKYPDFKFIGPSPIDFDKKKLFGQCVWNDLCNFSVKNYLNKGITKIGIILNTDPHYLSGSHWICLFVNLKKRFIYYFDSNADATPKQVKTFIQKVKNQANKINIKLDEYVNKTEHQKSDTECGMYVLYIITELLKHNKNPNFKERIPDKDMENLRKIFFN